MKPNLNVDIKFYANQGPGSFSNSLSKYTDKIAGKDSGDRGQGHRGSRDSYGSGTQSRGGHRSRMVA